MPLAVRRPSIRSLTLPAAAVLAAALLAAPSTATAQQGLDASATLKASTLGFGAEFGKLLTSNLGVRVGGATLSYDHEREVDGITYDGALSLRSVQGFVDLFPWRRGAFRVTAGVVSGTNEVAATGVPDAGGEYTVDGQTYAGSDVGTLVADVAYARTRPYAGIGWGTPASRDGGFGVVVDLGAVYGAPALALGATGPAASNAQFQADLAAQRASSQEDLDRYGRFYPVVGLGLSYRF